MVLFEKRSAMGSPQNANDIVEKLGVSQRLATLLCERGYDDAEKARVFLSPSVSQWLDPYLFPSMQDAVDCILAAGSMGIKICVYGDYDCDGICAASLLTRFLQSMNFEVMAYIPSRHDEGYGLNKAAIDWLAEQGIELIITVDCGITAVDEIAYAYARGLEVVLTDHHQCPSQLPSCEAILNPNMGEYPFVHLCGAGVALKLVQAIGGVEAALEYTDIAAIATVADIVSLTDENRAIVSEGLKRIREGKTYPGIRALADISGCECDKLEATQIAFSLAPRINAMGRIGSAIESLRLFLTDDEQEARALAKTLHEENKLRQELEREILQEAETMISEGAADPTKDNVIILASEDWNSGVIGIVASRLVKHYHRPVLLFAGSDDCWTGSGRSLRGIHLHDELAPFRDMFERFGGHEMAAGLTLRKDRYDEFRSLFIDTMNRLPAHLFLPIAHYDLEQNVEKINESLLDDLGQMAPFGTGNAMPTLLLKDAAATQVQRMGSAQEHLCFQIGETRAIAFGLGAQAQRFRNEKMDLLVQVEKNCFRGQETIQARVVDQRTTRPSDIQAYIETREDLFYDSIAERIAKKPVHKKITPTAIYSQEEMMSQILASLQDRPQGVMVVASSPEGARTMLEMMLQEGELDRIEIAWESWQDDCAYNTLLLAPKWEKCQRHGIHKMFFWDGIFDEQTLGLLDGTATEIYTVSNTNSNWLKNLFISRKKLIPIYNAILAFLRTESTFPTKSDFEHEFCSKTNLSLFELRQGIRIFSELDFLRVEEGVPFIITVNPKKVQRDLSESDAYCAAENVYARYEKLK